ncbi:MAG: Maf family nucleotide pyrophosphatase, partial [Planctomycetota bacterium]|nr:Maf family nucleotide pyrophosphatase [Planctomycetota bacterium]
MRLRRRRLPALALPMFFLLMPRPAAAGEEVPRLRLAADAGGGLFGGWQRSSRGGGEFELFAAPPGGSAASLGRFIGRLAGVALDPAGRRLALTSDGALTAHGGEMASLALPGDHWNMLDLAWFSGGPAALHHDAAGDLWLVRPEAADSWRIEGDAPLLRDSQLQRAVLAVLDGVPHLLWNAGAADLSRGAFRHLRRRDSVWEELPPLPLGDARAFSSFPRGNGLELAALIPEPLERAPARLALRFWRDGEWQPGREPPESLARILTDAVSLAGAPGGPDGNGAHWLTAGPDGVLLDGRPLAAGRPADPAWRGYAVPLSLVLFIALLALHCRRSRILSRLFPGQPADLPSRGAALIIDWLLASLFTAACHLASGNVRVYAELLNADDINSLFWLSLGVFTVYTTVFEMFAGATPGKRLAGIRVRSFHAGPPSTGQTLIRNLMRGIDMFPFFLPGLPGAAAAILTIPRRQRLGDLLASTIVRRHAPIQGRKFVLASASPRRRELMEGLGVDFTVSPSGMDEEMALSGDPNEMVRRLALAKAKVVANRLAGGKELVVAADTLVSLDGQAMGKPRDAAEAAGMLTRLSGRSHLVITGVALFDLATGQGIYDSEQTEVEMRALGREEIENYAASGD